MAFLSRCSCLARTGPLRGPGRACPSRRLFAAVLELLGSLFLVLDPPRGAFEVLIAIARALTHECDHTSTNAPDPIRTSKLNEVG